MEYDEEAFLKWYNKILWKLRYRSWDKHMADDLANQAALNTLKELARGVDPKWATQRLYFQYLKQFQMYVRKEVERCPLVYGGDDLMIVAEANNKIPEQKALRHLDLKTLYKNIIKTCRDKWGDQTAQIMTARAEGYTYKEIQEMLGISSQRVHQIFSRAVKHIRESSGYKEAQNIFHR